MPRNHSSGSYSTPAGQPVISGTVISAATENALVSDLANEMSDSLSRAGYGGMNAPIRTPDGAVNAPAHSFTSETGTGIYRIGASDVGLAISGVKTHEWTASGETVTGDETVTGNLSVQGATGATVTTGNIGLSASGAQNITKSGTGNLWIQSGAGQDIKVNPSVSTWIFNGTSGHLVSDTSHTVTGLSTPSNSSDAATKGYVDPVNGSASISWSTGWADTSSRTRLTKFLGIVVLNLEATASAGNGSTVITLPSGYRPVTQVYGIGMDLSSTTANYCAVQTDGTVVGSFANLTNGHTLGFSIAFSTV